MRVHGGLDLKIRRFSRQGANPERLEVVRVSSIQIALIGVLVIPLFLYSVLVDFLHVTSMRATRAARAMLGSGS